MTLNRNITLSDPGFWWEHYIVSDNTDEIFVFENTDIGLENLLQHISTGGLNSSKWEDYRYVVTSYGNRYEWNASEPIEQEKKAVTDAIYNLRYKE